MIRWGSWVAIALALGLTPASYGQFGGSGGGLGGSGRAGATPVSFGSAGLGDAQKDVHCPVKIIGTDGKATMGEIRLRCAVISCAWGIYEIKPEMVQEIRFGVGPGGSLPAVESQTGQQRHGQIVTTTGEVIDGVVLLPSWWRVETELGVLTPKLDGIKTIAFSKKTDAAPPADLVPPSVILPPPATENASPPSSPPPRF